LPTSQQLQEWSNKLLDHNLVIFWLQIFWKGLLEDLDHACCATVCYFIIGLDEKHIDKRFENPLIGQFTIWRLV
jgi:hypothetical protein